MEQSLVSIVIPVYNAEMYLKECLDSVISQTYSNIEIIVVNDGSTDNSGEICEEYSRRDDRVIVIHQENRGAAVARRTGIRRATGEYIGFVDADDTIKRNMIEYFVSNIEDADMITSGCDCEKYDSKRTVRYDAFKEGKYDTTEQMEFIIKNMIVYDEKFVDGILPYLWGKMYKCELMKKTVEEVCEDIRYGEDRELLWRYILESKSIIISKEVLYFYRNVETSVCRGINVRFMKDLNNLYLSLEKVFVEHPLRESLMRQLRLFVTSRIYWITQQMKFDNLTGTVKYVCPFVDKLKGKRVVIYGAGLVGANYYRQFRNNEAIDIVLWVDKDNERYMKKGMPVVGIDQLNEENYDMIVVAVKDEVVVENIKEELLEKGVTRESIWWEEPINVWV